MPIYGYNYPWSGRLGRCAECCVVCGDSGPSFHLSSRSQRCTRCRSAATPDPELVARAEAIMERNARRWCAARGIDYEATIANYRDHLGPPRQERDGPIPGAEIDYTVWERPPGHGDPVG